MSLTAVTALDGRYAGAVAPLSQWFSEHALIRERVRVELAWLEHLAAEPGIEALRPLAAAEVGWLREIAATFSVEDSEAVKRIERTTNHDVKAVEYWIKERLAATSLADVREWVHFACTSEDINNLAHALMLRGGVGEVFLSAAVGFVDKVAALASEHVATPVLSRTHGQPASPSTFGKEMAVFVHRWHRVLGQIRGQQYLGKLNGAVGAYNAHVSAYPNVDWPDVSRRFVEGLGLTWNPTTTQIESHDGMAELFQALVRFLNILLDFDRDVWGYVSLGYLRQRVVAGEVGSSTMPHKVNPIDFENSEANAGIGVALLEHLASKLAISRWQRDLTDSSALRNMGSAVGHGYLAVVAATRGMGKVSVDAAALASDLGANWEVLAEPVQTVMRAAGLENPYERLKELTRGARLGPDALREFVGGLGLPAADAARLASMTPATYVGLSEHVARETLDRWMSDTTLRD